MRTGEGTGAGEKMGLVDEIKGEEKGSTGLRWGVAEDGDRRMQAGKEGMEMRAT